MVAVSGTSQRVRYGIDSASGLRTFVGPFLQLSIDAALAKDRAGSPSNEPVVRCLLNEVQNVLGEGPGQRWMLAVIPLQESMLPNCPMRQFKI